MLLKENECNKMTGNRKGNQMNRLTYFYMRNYFVYLNISMLTEEKNV